MGNTDLSGNDEIGMELLSKKPAVFDWVPNGCQAVTDRGQRAKYRPLLLLECA